MKSNIRAKLANSGSGSRKKFFSKLNQQKIRKKAGHKVKMKNLVDDYTAGSSGQSLMLMLLNIWCRWLWGTEAGRRLSLLPPLKRNLLRRLSQDLR